MHYQHQQAHCLLPQWSRSWKNPLGRGWGRCWWWSSAEDSTIIWCKLAHFTMLPQEAMLSGWSHPIPMPLTGAGAPNNAGTFLGVGSLSSLTSKPMFQTGQYLPTYFGHWTQSWQSLHSTYLLWQEQWLLVLQDPPQIFPDPCSITVAYRLAEWSRLGMVLLW